MVLDLAKESSGLRMRVAISFIAKFRDNDSLERKTFSHALAVEYQRTRKYDYRQCEDNEEFPNYSLFILTLRSPLFFFSDKDFHLSFYRIKYSIINYERHYRAVNSDSIATDRNPMHQCSFSIEIAIALPALLNTFFILTRTTRESHISLVHTVAALYPVIVMLRA